jgi:hypothetical protein
MNIPISFEIAKLLKEKGFNEQGLSIYLDGEIEELRSTISNNQFMTSRTYSAPTIAEVVMWLYEKHEIWISVFSTDDVTMFSYKISSKFGQHYSPNFNSPTEAYEAGIKYVLEKLI